MAVCIASGLVVRRSSSLREDRYRSYFCCVQRDSMSFEAKQKVLKAISNHVEKKAMLKHRRSFYKLHLDSESCTWRHHSRNSHAYACFDLGVREGRQPTLVDNLISNLPSLRVSTFQQNFGRRRPRILVHCRRLQQRTQPRLHSFYDLSSMNFPRLFSLLLGACPSKKAPRLALNAVRSRSRPFSISSPRPVLPKAIAEATVFHDAMTQSFRDARLPLEPKQDEVFTGDYYSLSIDGAIVKVSCLAFDEARLFLILKRERNLQ